MHVLIYILQCHSTVIPIIIIVNNFNTKNYCLAEDIDIALKRPGHFASSRDYGTSIFLDHVTI